MTRLILVLATAALIATGCGGSGDDDAQTKPGEPVEITMWHGQNDIAGSDARGARRRVQRTHKNIQVKASTGGVVADEMLQKITTALASGDYPDIAYIFGSDLANLARPARCGPDRPGQRARLGWDDYYTPAATR